MAWTIEYAQSVQKLTKKLDPVVRMRIRQFLEERLVVLVIDIGHRSKVYR